MIVIDLDPIIVRSSTELFLGLTAFIQDDYKKPESGGILIGYFQENNSYIITDFTKPGHEDKQSRFGFVRSKKNAQKEVNFFFKESEGKKIYLGEWHTHPEDFPSPSSTDKASIWDRIQKDRINAETIFMIIFGRKGIYISAVNKSRITIEREISYVELELIIKKQLPDEF